MERIDRVPERSSRQTETTGNEADILGWLLPNSTREEALEEAVKSVAGANANQYIPYALDKYGASNVLSERLILCLKIAPGLPKISLVDEKLFSTEEGLYRWEYYTEYLRPLAFAVRTKVMLATECDEDIIQRERSESDLLQIAGMTDTLCSMDTAQCCGGRIDCRKN
jgi:hypothetical protein